MIQLLPNSEILTPNTISAEDTIDFISEYIEKYHCKFVDIDISFLNILDSCFVTTMCNTKHFIKYPDGKINWIVSSELIREFNKDMELGNSNYRL